MARSSAKGIMELDRAIWSIMEKHEISGQHTFLSLLEEQNLKINQSTLSRHLRKLGIRKQDGIYRAIEVESAGKINPNLALEVVSAPPNLLLLKTLPGHANAVGYYLETFDVHGIAGTVAGNDTLMVAINDTSLLEQVQREIERLFNLGDAK